MIRTILALATGAVLLAACAAQPGTAATPRDDDTYVPIGSNIPRRGKPEERASMPLPPGPYIGAPGTRPTAPR